MTAIIGVLCTDGVVVGTDSSGTFTAGQLRTIEQPTEKLDILSDRIVLAGTGQIGLGQRFKRIVEHAWGNNVFKGDAIEVCRQLSAAAIQDFNSTAAQRGQYGAVVVFPVGNKLHLCEFAEADFQPELKLSHPRLWYVSMGSTQLITDPFLAFIREVFWVESQPNVKQATFAVLWTLEHAISVNPGGVNGPPRLATAQRIDGECRARLLTAAELDEHRQAIALAKQGLRSALESLGGTASSAPDVPQPTR